MRCTCWMALGGFAILWMGCGTEAASDDADAGGSGTGGSGGSANAAGAAGTAGTAGAGLPTECEAISQLPPACNECLQTNCDQTCLAMQNHPEADAHQACMDACTDDACIDACNAAFPAFTAAVEAHLACMEAECCETCTCCMCEACSLTTNDDECDACIYDKCLDSCVTVDMLPGSHEYFDCQNACTDDACLGECDSAHPEPAAAFGELKKCVLSACATTCGDVAWP